MENEAVPMDTLAKVYLKIRTKIQEKTQLHEKEVAELELQKSEIAAAMREQMKAAGAKSINTAYGTVMLSIKTRYSTQDWDSFKTFIMQNNAVDLLERRIAQKNMATFLEANPGAVPPGLNADSQYEVTVRKPTK